jgi:hypothetical protein
MTPEGRSALLHGLREFAAISTPGMPV